MARRYGWLCAAAPYHSVPGSVSSLTRPNQLPEPGDARRSAIADAGLAAAPDAIGAGIRDGSSVPSTEVLKSSVKHVGHDGADLLGQLV
jgi:hypothetical protein